MKKLKGSDVTKIRAEFTEREFNLLIWAVQIAEKKICKELKDSRYYGHVSGNLQCLSAGLSPISDKDFFIPNSLSLLKNIKYYDNCYANFKESDSNDHGITIRTKHYKQRLSLLKKWLKEVPSGIVEVTKELLDKGEI